MMQRWHTKGHSCFQIMRKLKNCYIHSRVGSYCVWLNSANEMEPVKLRKDLNTQ